MRQAIRNQNRKNSSQPSGRRRKLKSNQNTRNSLNNQVVGECPKVMDALRSLLDGVFQENLSSNRSNSKLEPASQIVQRDKVRVLNKRRAHLVDSKDLDKFSSAPQWDSHPLNNIRISNNRMDNTDNTDHTDNMDNPKFKSMDSTGSMAVRGSTGNTGNTVVHKGMVNNHQGSNKPADSLCNKELKREPL